MQLTCSIFDKYRVMLCAFYWALKGGASWIPFISPSSIWTVTSFLQRHYRSYLKIHVKMGPQESEFIHFTLQCRCDSVPLGTVVQPVHNTFLCFFTPLTVYLPNLVQWYNLCKNMHYCVVLTECFFLYVYTVI